MAIKAKPKRRAQSSHSRGAFPRRLTWREIESAFGHLFEAGIDTTEAARVIHRFKRARSQLLPIFSVMCVSPYERERTLAVDLLSRIGGRTTLEMVQSLLSDIDVYDAFKFDLRRLAEKLEVEAARHPEEDEDEGDDETTGASESEDDVESGDRRGRGRSRRGRAGAARGKRGGDRDETESADAPSRPRGRQRLKPLGEAEAAKLFKTPGDAFLAALDGPIDRLVAGFWLIDEGKRVSFCDRLAKIDDRRLVPFLTALLASDQRGLVQSSLKAIAALGSPAALDGVNALLAREPVKAIRSRAEAVREQLLQAVAAGAAEPATADRAADAEPTGRRSRRARPRPKNAELLATEETVEPEALAIEAAEPARVSRPDAAALGLCLPTTPAAEAAGGEPIEATARLPRLQNCLASAVGPDGAQWIWVYRAGSGGTLERLSLLVSESGWLAARLDQGLAGDADRADLAAAAEAGQPRVEVTMAYGRRRVQQAAAVNADHESALPPNASAAMAWLGSGRRVEVEDEGDAETLADYKQEQVRELLEHPLMAAWQVSVTPDGQATAQWLATRRRRSASRQRKLLIDDVVNAWLDQASALALAERLRLQAWLLRRADQAELADVAQALAAQLTGDHPVDNMLLREIVYRALGAALDEVRDLRHAERAAHAELAAAQTELTADQTAEPIDEADAEDDDSEDEAGDEAAEPRSDRRRDGRRRGGRQRGGRNRRRGPGRAMAKKLVATRCRRRRLKARLVREATARRLRVSSAVRARQNRARRRRR